MSLREFYDGFAMEILISGVMGCKIYDGLMKVFANFILFYDGFMGFACGFSGLAQMPAS